MRNLGSFSDECTAGFLTCRDFLSVEILGRLENPPYAQMKNDPRLNDRIPTNFE